MPKPAEAANQAASFSREAARPLRHGAGDGRTMRDRYSRRRARTWHTRRRWRPRFRAPRSASFATGAACGRARCSCLRSRRLRGRCTPSQADLRAQWRKGPRDGGLGLEKSVRVVLPRGQIRGYRLRQRRSHSTHSGTPAGASHYCMNASFMSPELHERGSHVVDADAAGGAAGRLSGRRGGSSGRESRPASHGQQESRPASAPRHHRPG
jgi:hypothetical protein